MIDCSIYYKRVEPEAFRSLRDGAALATACDEAFHDCKRSPQQSAALVQTWFATWMRFRWLCPRAGKLLPRPAL